MAELKGLVRALCEGDDPAKAAAARALGNFAYNNSANKAAIAKARGIPPLVDLLRDGSAKAKEDAARTLSSLACSIANGVLIVADGAIPPLIDLLRDGSADAASSAAWALHYIAYNNDGNAVAIAAAVGLEALIQLARRGRATVDKRSRNELRVGVPGKRKAALVVAALLRACVPDEARGQVQDVIRDVIGPYL